MKRWAVYFEKGVKPNPKLAEKLADGFAPGSYRVMWELVSSCYKVEKYPEQKGRRTIIIERE